MARGWMVVLNGDSGGVVPCDKRPTLAAVQEAVGGYVELVTSDAIWEGERAEVYCNEEGKIHGLPANLAATEYVRSQIPTFDDTLVGPVVILVGSARWAGMDDDGE